MVTLDMTVYRIETRDSVFYVDSTEYADMSESQRRAVVSKKTAVARGELLTMDDVEAQRLGFSRSSVGTLDEVLEEAGLGAYRRVRVEENWSEAFVRFLTTISPILWLSTDSFTISTDSRMSSG